MYLKIISSIAILTLPSYAKKGKYNVITTLKSSLASGSKETSFRYGNVKP